MTVSIRAVAVVAALGFATPAFAQTTANVEFGGGKYAYAGVYVAQYELMVPSLGGPTIDAFCVDAKHTVRSGQAWTAYVSPLTGDLSKTRVGSAATYLQTAFLATMLEGITETSASNNEKRAEIHAAIWYLTGGTTPWGNPFTPWVEWDSRLDFMDVQSYVTLAQQGAQTVSASDWLILSDTEGRAQEFLVRAPTNVVPEPEVWLLLGTGLAGVLGAAFFRGSLLG